MSDSNPLNPLQREIYQFIRGKIEDRGYGPTVREIGDAFKIQSPSAVMGHLKALEEKNLVKREGFGARAIQLLGHLYTPHDDVQRLREKEQEARRLREKVEELESQVAILTRDREVQEAYIHELKHQRYCWDCLRNRDEW